MERNLTANDADLRGLRWRGLAFAALGLVAAFCVPLFELARYSLGSDLYSHVLLIPCISVYLAWTRRETLPGYPGPDRALAVTGWIGGLVALAAYWIFVRPGRAAEPDDSLALTTLSFLCLFIGCSAWFLGRPVMRALAFPMGFLVFMVPFPLSVMAGIETFLQHSSAMVAYALFWVTGTSMFYHDLSFQLPGIVFQVAPECSGSHSTLALFITSLLAGYFFFRSPGRRAILALAVIPLGILRNGLRVYVIGELCVHVGPDMINSYIHRHGGPVFFVASLVPFFWLLVRLLKSERRSSASPGREGKPRQEPGN